MWLMTRHGFFSPGQKEPGRFRVREWERLDLETFGIPIALAWRQLKIAFGLLKTEATRGRLHRAYWADL